MTSLPPCVNFSMPRHSALRLSTPILGKENEKTPLPPSSPSGSICVRRSRNRSVSTVSPVNETASPLASRASRRRSTNSSITCGSTFVRHARSPSRSRNSQSEGHNLVSRAPLQALYSTVTFTLPRQLPRHPAIVTSERLAVLDERLMGIPVKFLHKRLREMSPLLVYAISLHNMLCSQGTCADCNRD